MSSLKGRFIVQTLSELFVLLLAIAGCGVNGLAPGPSAGADAGAGTSAGPDAGAGLDAGTDAGAGLDAGTDAGAGLDAGVDAGTDGGGGPLPKYTVGGNISGSLGGLVLRNSGGADLLISSNGPFTFPTAVENGSTYDVTVWVQPSGQICSVTGGKGIINGANVTNVAVVCSGRTMVVVFDCTRSTSGSDAPNSNFISNIWRVNSDGAALTPITTAASPGASGSNPRWSPDGTRIVFHSSRKLDGTDAANPSRTYNIWRVNADGSGLTPLTKATMAGADSQDPQWSPDGTKIVFRSRRKVDGTDAPNSNLTFNIWRVNADGAVLTPLTKATAAGADSHSPQWSPDGTKIVFYSSRNPDGTDAWNDNLTYNIWQVNAEGTVLTPLTNATVQQAHSYNPQWSPDGTKIVFYSSRNLNLADEAHPNLTFNLWQVNADSTGLMPLTNTPVGAHSFNPQWSPDGTKIVFHSNRKLNGTAGLNLASNLWRVNADGNGLIPLTNTATPGTDSTDPQWSPDGSRVVFRSRRTLAGTDALGMVYNIWWVNADGTGLTALTRATAWGADCYNPQLKR